MWLMTKKKPPIILLLFLAILLATDRIVATAARAAAQVPATEKPAQDSRARTGKVVHVIDGDSLELELGQERIVVRLQGIDAPEYRQAYGKASRTSLAKLTLGKQVTVTSKGVDKENRLLGVLWVDGIEVNARQIELGMAWHFDRFDSRETLARLQREAREAKRGLWSEPRPLPPWEYRDRRQQANKPRDPNALYWLNTRSNIRHNESCEYFQKSNQGRLCRADEGRPCSLCGG